MEKSWIKKGPPSGLLIAKKKDERHGKANGTAIVIPSYSDPALLDTHLSLLSRQTTSGFDIIIIYGDKDGFNKNVLGQSILHIRPHANLGCAGSFYLGERICLEEDYTKIILADDDCHPESMDLIEKLEGRLSDAPLARPLIRLIPTHKLTRSIVHHYGAFRRECLERTGLTFLPFFLGGEDFDLMRRLRENGLEFAEIDSVATHARWPPIFIWNMRKMQSYSAGNILQLIIARDIIRTWMSMSIHLQTCAGLMLLGKHGQSMAYLESALSASRCDFSSENGSGPQPGPIAVRSEKSGFTAEKIVKNQGSEARDTEDDAFMQFQGNDPISKSLGKSIRMLRENPLSSLNRNVLFDGWCNVKDLPSILLSKGAGIRFEGNTYLISKDRHLIAILLSSVGFLAAIPLCIGLGFLLSVRGIAHAVLGRISSEGYGLPISSNRISDERAGLA